MMANYATKSFCSEINETNEFVEQETTKQLAEIIDIKNGKQMDSKSVRIKLSDEESVAIDLLRQHYGERLGEEISLTKLVSILLNKSLTETFAIDFKALNKLTDAGMNIQMPKVSIAKTFGVR
jgi:hypothetical protein